MNLDQSEVNRPEITGDIFPSTMSVEQPTETPTQSQSEVTPPPSTQKVVIGDRVFNSQEEALAYADGFVQSQKKTQVANNPTVEPPADVSHTKRPGQLIFEDPDQALADVENRALERMRTEQRAIEENRKFWEDFYLKHPDLKGSELLVDAVLGRENSLGSMNGMSREQAAPILAAKARQEVSKIRNVPSGGQALPSNPAMVAGASGASTPKAPVPSAAPQDFVSQLRNMRKRG